MSSPEVFSFYIYISVILYKDVQIAPTLGEMNVLLLLKLS